jgi:hypothetical protein
MFSFLSNKIYQKIYEKLYYYEYKCTYCGCHFKGDYIDSETPFCKMTCGMKYFSDIVKNDVTTTEMNSQEKT